MSPVPLAQQAGVRHAMAPPVLALRADAAVPPWELRQLAQTLSALSPRVLVQGASTLLLDLSWQRGCEQEAARQVLDAVPAALPARAGVGRGIVPAVLATHLARVGRVFFLPEDEDERMMAIAHLPVSLLPLPAWARRRLELLGLGTLSGLQRAPRESLVQLLGQAGELAWLWARGLDPRPFPVAPQRPEEVGAEVEMPRPELSPEALSALLVALVREAFAQAEGRACTGLELVAETAVGAPYRLSCRFAEPVASAEEGARALSRRLAVQPPPGPLLRARVVLLGLVREWGRQEGLLGGARDRRGLAAACRELARRYGSPQVFRPVEARPWEALPERRWLLAPFSP